MSAYQVSEYCLSSDPYESYIQWLIPFEHNKTKEQVFLFMATRWDVKVVATKVIPLASLQLKSIPDIKPQNDSIPFILYMAYDYVLRTVRKTDKPWFHYLSLSPTKTACVSLFLESSLENQPYEQWPVQFKAYYDSLIEPLLAAYQGELKEDYEQYASSEKSNLLVSTSHSLSKHSLLDEHCLYFYLNAVKARASTVEYQGIVHFLSRSLMHDKYKFIENYIVKEALKETIVAPSLPALSMDTLRAVLKGWILLLSRDNPELENLQKTLRANLTILSHLQPKDLKNWFELKQPILQPHIISLKDKT